MAKKYLDKYNSNKEKSHNSHEKKSDQKTTNAEETQTPDQSLEVVITNTKIVVQRNYSEVFTFPNSRVFLALLDALKDKNKYEVHVSDMRDEKNVYTPLSYSIINGELKE